MIILFLYNDANLRHRFFENINAKMLLSGLISRTITKRDIGDYTFSIDNSEFRQITNEETNGGAIFIEINEKLINFSSLLFNKCSSIIRDSRGGAIFLDCPNSKINAISNVFIDCTANFGQGVYIENLYDTRFVDSCVSGTNKINFSNSKITRQNNLIEFLKTSLKMTDFNETNNAIKGDVSCVKMAKTNSIWHFCTILNNSCHCYSLFIESGTHHVSNVTFNHNIQESSNDEVVFLGEVNIEVTNANNCTFSVKGAGYRKQLSIIRSKLDASITYFDKDAHYKNRENLDESVNMLFVYIAVPVICLVVFLIGIVWYFIAKLCEPGYYMAGSSDEENDIVNDPKFTDTRYFLDRNTTAQVSTKEEEGGVKTAIRKKHIVTLSDGEEEDQYYSDDSSSSKKQNEVGLKDITKKNNNPLWAAALMNDTDDPFNNDFEEDEAVRLYKKGATVTPKLSGIKEV